MLGKHCILLAIVLFLATTIGCKSEGEDKEAPVAGAGGAITATVDGPWSATLKWSAATDNETRSTALQYQVLISRENNLGTVADAQANGQIVKDWTADTTQAALSGLDDGETYYITVIAKDELGNVVNYQVASFTTEDATGPTAGANGTITISDVNNTSASVQWTAATDGVSGADKLLYRVVYSTLAGVGSLGTTSTNIMVALDWTAGATDTKLSGLKDGTSYYVQVLVKDEAGLISTYEPATFTTSDGTSPVPGNGGQLTVSELGLNGAKLTWIPAVDGLAEAHLLSYKVVYSTESNIGSPTDAETNGTVAKDWTANLQSATLSGLTAETTYYATVLVRDEDGNIAQYAVVELKTQSVDSDVTAPVPGNGGQLTLANITQTGASLSWVQAVDTRVAAHLLEYKILVSKSDNIGNPTDAETNGTVARDWTPNLSSSVLSGLDLGTDYWVTTLVRDTANNVASYAVVKFTTVGADTAGPKVDGVMIPVVTNITATTTTVAWSRAKDDTTPTNQLQYKVVISFSDNIGTVDDADITQNGDGKMLVQDWTTDIDNLDLKDLSPGVTYYVTVLVRDAAGNVETYVSVFFTTEQSGLSAAPGADGELLVSARNTWFRLNWARATDAITAQHELQYLVVVSDSPNIGDPASAQANGTPVNDEWQNNISSIEVDELDRSTTYWVNVLVRNSAGVVSVYGMVAVTTTNRVHLFAPFTVNAAHIVGHPSPRSSYNGKCYGTRPTSSSDPLRDWCRSNVIAFMSTGNEDTLATLGANNNFPMSAELWGSKGRISPSLLNFLDNTQTAELSFKDAGVPRGYNDGPKGWWSMSTDDGTFSTNCLDGDDSGALGDVTATDKTRLYSNSAPCSGEPVYWIVCLCF